MKQLPVHVIITGGTIDSFYNGAKDTVTTAKVSAIPDYIHSLQLHTKVTTKVVCMKDSRAITNSDRTKIIVSIQKSPAKNVIITHGTYTMPDTARFLASRLKNNKKKIVLTGSMIPLIGFSPSDAGFNLGFAMGKFDSLEPGIYVAMNGRIFSPDEVVKLISLGRFSSILNK